MLRIIQNTSSASAKSYYSKADYYSEGQELTGRWGGKGATRLGLEGEVSQQAFESLCENRHPQTGEKLTPRMKSDRTVGYDFNFHVPKGVSVVYALNQDERILEAFRESVHETMEEMEAEMKTRVRTGGRDQERTTGNLAWAEFVHFTARPVKGVPDPHLHAHCFVANQTFDSEEGRWKAGQFRDLKRDSPYFQAVFHARLGKRLHELGYPIARTGRQWDLADVPKSLTQKFSRRTEQVERFASDKQISDPDKKSALGARTREKKQSELSLPELRQLWRDRLSDSESATLKRFATSDKQPLQCSQDAEQRSLAHAIEHCFERNSVIPERTLLAEALTFGVGEIDADKLSGRLKQTDVIVRTLNGRSLATTREVLVEERNMLNYARDGRGKCEPLNPSWKLKREWLNEGQRAAVRHVLTNRDRVAMVKGRAGTGKTSLMQETVEAIQANGKTVFTFAPSAEASRGVLRREGFANATTVAELLVDPRLQVSAKGQVLWIDEAGLLGTRTLKQVFDVAEKIDARVIMSGDWLQHSSPERGEAMRLLEREGGIKPATVTDIQRQKERYREAVGLLADGKTPQGFRILDDLGWIKEFGDGQREQQIAKDYANAVARGDTVLAIAPTHAEGERVTHAIREELKSRTLLDKNDRFVKRLVSRNLTDAERADPAMYAPGDVIVFHQNAAGHRKGSRLVVGDHLPDDLKEVARHFQVFRQAELPIAEGDLVRMTANGKTADGNHRLNNGAVYRVDGFSAAGELILDNGWTIDSTFGFINHGYVVTSHASQGRTVDTVLVSESSWSFPAATPEQFYVSVSRAKKQAHIYTDSKSALSEAIGESVPQMSAVELLANKVAREAAHSRSMAVGESPKSERRKELVHER